MKAATQDKHPDAVVTRTRRTPTTRPGSVLAGSMLAGAIVAGAIAAGATLPAQAQTAPAQAAAPTGMIRAQINADIRSTDPGVNRDANSDAVVLHMVEGLVAYREDVSVGPLLAESIETSADGKTYTFKLRQGVTFSNGEPLTSADVLASWNRYMTPATNWRCLSEFDGRNLIKVEKVDTPDPMTVVFTLNKPSTLFLNTMARTDCGGTGIVHRSSVGADGKWVAPIGTGPFMLAEWRKGQYVELDRNPRYRALPGARDGNTGGKAAQVAKVRFVVVPDSATAKAALLSGDIDLIYNINDEDLPEYKARKDISIASSPNLNLQGLLFQTKDPLLGDVRIRRAIALALDLPELVNATTSGTAKPSRSVIPMPSSFYGPVQAAQPRRDVAAAKKLLAEAGYKGQPIKLLTSKRYSSIFNIAILTQAMAQDAGLNVDVEVLEWATLLDRYNKGNYQAMAFTYSSRPDPSLSYEMVSGDKASQPRKVWDNPAGLALIQQSMEVSDKAARQKIFDELEGLMRADTPAVFMYSSVNAGAARAAVVGYQGWPLGLPRLWGVALR
jgi:peptide/nickel transport system substrate-binding protein